jgi:predicted dehydrogenase
MENSRRDFLKTAAVAATAASANRVLGAGNRIRIGVIGNGGRGQYLMKTLKQVAPDDFEFVAVCDIYDVRRAEAAAIAGGKVEQYLDYRQLLERKDIDAVIVATPDHWHGTIATDALNAGKDVYVEKPMVHKPQDGLSIVKAARANHRIVQVGMQGRLLPQFVEAKEKYIDTKIIGKVGLARTWYLSNSGYVRTPPTGFEKQPTGLDWNRWLGSGPRVPWNPDIYFSPYKWLYYDGGMIMGIGIHVLDDARHWLNIRKPASAMCGGGTYFFKDGRDTPDVVTGILDYEEGLTVTFTAECLTAPGVKASAGVELRASGGILSAERYLPTPGYSYTPNNANSKVPAGKGEGTAALANNLLKNWLECIRDRKRTAANEDEGYYSAVTCYMINEAYRTKSRVLWDKRWDLPA